MELEESCAETGAPEVSIEAVRDAVEGALGDARLNGLAANAPLVRSGMISSLEIVTVSLALGERFAVRIPDSAVTIDNFDSLAGMTRLVTELKRGATATASGSAPEVWHRPLKSLASALRRPITFMLLTAAFFVVLDLALQLVMKGPLAEQHHAFLEQGHRLYPVSGGYSGDDLTFAVSRHRLVQFSNDAGPRIGFLGDSGTIGSWVKHWESIPARTEESLKKRLPSAQVFNIAFFMQFLAKDLMMLEAAMQATGKDRPFDVVVFTLGDAYFFRPFILSLPTQMPFLHVNRELLANFAARLPAASRPPFDSVVRDLDTAGAGAVAQFDRWFKKTTAISHYAPFFRFFVDELPFIESLNSNYDFDGQFRVGRISLYSPVPESPPPPFAPHLAPGASEADFDESVRSMLKATISFLRERGVKVVIYLKPKGPKEWKDFYPTVGKLVVDVADEICGGGQCAVVDERWSVSGAEFTDSVAHYNAAANRRIGDHVAAAILKELGP